MSGRQFVRQDVKARTMNRYAATLDPDIASNYEDLDDMEGGGSYRNRGGGSRLPRLGGGRGGSQQILPRRMLGMIEGHLNSRRDRPVRNPVAGHGQGPNRRDNIYLITVKNASRAGKEHILKLLADAVDQFLPISPKIDESGDLSFFVLTEDDAEAVVSMSKRIADKHNPNMKYTIYKNRRMAPFDSLGHATRQTIEQILKSRYNPTINSLDLSSFQNDPVFARSGESPRGLFHNNVMVVVADYVARHFRGIKGIRLNNNSLRTLDFVSALVYAAPDVVELDLANNAISRVDELAKLSGWHLESTHFENNEFTTQFANNFHAYTNAIHVHFPRVSYLDGVHVTPETETSSATTAHIPKFKPGFNMDEGLRKMIENFLVEYYNFYDGPNGEQTRQQLINAYDANATFSYSISTVPDTQFVDRGDPEIFQQYMRNSHNIITQHKWQAFRDRLLFRGPMDIAVALSKLPPTEHVKQSFLLDFNLVSNNLVVTSLQGIFRDGKDNIGMESATRPGLFKFFARQLVIVPKAEGLAILSDIVQITAISARRMENYNNLLKNATIQMNQSDGMAPPPPSPQQTDMAFSSLAHSLIKQEPAGPSTSSTSILGGEGATMRAEMVKQFCLFSGMKPEWAEKCLQDCSWNWADAQKAFSNMRSHIPQEAFATVAAPSFGST